MSMPKSSDIDPETYMDTIMIDFINTLLIGAGVIFYTVFLIFGALTFFARKTLDKMHPFDRDEFDQALKESSEHNAKALKLLAENFKHGRDHWH